MGVFELGIVLTGLVSKGGAWLVGNGVVGSDGVGVGKDSG